MRRARWLLLAALFATLAYVVATYFDRRDVIAKDTPQAPKLLDAGIDGQAQAWDFTQYDGDCPATNVRAADYTQVKESSVWELKKGVQLKLFHHCGKEYDLVKSAEASFDTAAKSLYSDGEVDIMMAVPADGAPSGRLLKIHTSGVRFASDTGKASTERAATFEFDRGGGSAVGADYDPKLKELSLKSNVVLNWHGGKSKAVPIRVEAGEAVYREMDSRVTLAPWSKLVRGSLIMDAGVSIVTLEHGEVRSAAALKARGVQDDPGRKIEFAADDLTLDFTDGMVVQKVQGNHNAKLVSTAPTARTTVTGDRLDLGFVPSGRESILTTAVSSGKSIAESVPLPRPGAELPETRTLKSEVIRLNMRPGGQEIEGVETDGKATLDFIPNRPTQAKRSLEGDRIWIAYGKQNQIQSFRSVNVTTRTERKTVATTRSKDFLATFEPATGALARIEQTTDFHYEEADQRAEGNRAVLNQLTQEMTLEGSKAASARFWDSTGQAAADKIVLDQKTGDYTAEGQVATTRQPDRKGNSSAMLSNQEVLQGRAQKVVSTKGNQHLEYRGAAVLWQGANRVQADQIDIDREGHILDARGNVVSQFVDRPPANADAKAKTSAIYTVIKAPQMRYTDDTRVAYYQGNVALTRPGLTVNSRELRAFLNDSSSDNSLDKAVADGAVKIISTSLDPKTRRTRTGTSEHADYQVTKQELRLEGGQPELVDSLKGKTTGRNLTWFANNDRLLVDGVENKPAESTIRKK